MSGNNAARTISCKQAKELDMVAYLERLGYVPAKINREDYSYLSPLRNERTASFKVNRRLNRWYDHGMGKGGSLLDFGILYFQCSLKDFLQILSGDFFIHQPYIKPGSNLSNEGRISVLNDFHISSYALIKYLSRRKIPVSVAEQFCREVRFKINDKTYFAIGFKNDAGGFELRNAFLKLGSAPKAVTTIRNGADILCVFEGFFDFLSYITLYGNTFSQQPDYLVLNSLSFFEKSLLFMEQYDRVMLYLDRDTSGQNCSRAAIERSTVYSDESCLYKGYEDINDWLVNKSGS